MTAAITLSRNATYTFTVTDKAGNIATFDYTVKWIDDKQPIPVGTAVVADPVIPVKTTVRLTYSFKDVGEDTVGNPTDAAFYGIQTATLTGGSFNRHSIGSTSADATLTGSLDVDRNADYVFTTVDKAGNQTDFPITITWIDHKNPVKDDIHFDAAPTKGPVTVHYTLHDVGTDNNGNPTADQHYGIASLKINGGEYNNTNLNKTPPRTTP